MDTLTSIKVFRQVVESGSFVGAADRLDLSTAMVSKHVMSIEKRLGVRLLNRNSRTISLTEPGRLYFERCKTILDDLEDTELELTSLNAAPRGVLRLTVPSWTSGQRMADLLAEYRRRYPEVVVDVSFEDRIVNLVEEGYDLAFRVTHDDSLAPGLVARRVRPVRFLLAASPQYLERHGVPKSPEDLRLHDFVAIGSLDALPLIGPEGPIQVPVRVVLRYRSLVGVAHAVAAGIGIAAVPPPFIEDPYFAGKLVTLLSDYPLQQGTFHVVYVSRKYVPLKIRSFVDFMVEAIKRIPEPKPGLSR